MEPKIQSNLTLTHEPNKYGAYLHPPSHSYIYILIEENTSSSGTVFTNDGDISVPLMLTDECVTFRLGVIARKYLGRSPFNQIDELRNCVLIKTCSALIAVSGTITLLFVNIFGMVYCF